MTQWQGLVSSCVSFPELLNSSVLLQVALGELDALLQAGVYPGEVWRSGALVTTAHPLRDASNFFCIDGVETEQASGYDMVTAGDFYSTLQLLADAGLPAPPSTFYAGVEQMWTYGGCGELGAHHPVTHLSPLLLQVHTSLTTALAFPGTATLTCATVGT